MRDVGKTVFKGVLLGMGLPVGMVLALHAFYIIGQTMLFFGFNQ